MLPFTYRAAIYIFIAVYLCPLQRRINTTVPSFVLRFFREIIIPCCRCYFILFLFQPLRHFLFSQPTTASSPGESRVRLLCGSCSKSSIITQSNWVTTLSLGRRLQCHSTDGRRVHWTLGVCLLICVQACSQLKISVCERERAEGREGERVSEREGKKQQKRASDQFQVSFLSNYRHQNRKHRSLPSGPVLPVLVPMAT